MICSLLIMRRSSRQTHAATVTPMLCQLRPDGDRAMIDLVQVGYMGRFGIGAHTKIQ